MNTFEQPNVLVRCSSRLGDDGHRRIERGGHLAREGIERFHVVRAALLVEIAAALVDAAHFDLCANGDFTESATTATQRRVHCEPWLLPNGACQSVATIPSVGSTMAGSVSP